MTTAIRPILANSCAQAATAEEARFRIDRPIGGRLALVVALDREASEIIDRLATREWRGARFLHPDDPVPPLDDVDAVVMIATGAAADVAAAFANPAAERGIMTAGLICGDDTDVVTALRPHARNLLVGCDEDDVAEVLTALRA